MVNRFGLIGCLADGAIGYDGQTVSTRLWRTYLAKVNTKKSMVCVDTYEYKKHIIRTIILSVKCVVGCSHIVFMLSENGLKIYLPLMYFTKKFLHKKIYHRVIGGDLNFLVEANPRWIKYLNSFDVNWVQSPNMVNRLSMLGVDNSKFLENYRDYEHHIVETSFDTINRGLFCTFCRVSKEKGISLAIETIAQIAGETDKCDIKLDIFGPIDDEYCEEFNGLVEKNKEYVEYKGCINSAEALPRLTHYYFHLFPTTWKGEGFPGTIIDCYNAGLPTIASNWAYNSEYVIDGKMGLIYDCEKPEMFREKIKEALELSDSEYILLRKNNLKEAQKYTSKAVMGKVMSFIENKK